MAAVLLQLALPMPGLIEETRIWFLQIRFEKPADGGTSALRVHWPRVPSVRSAKHRVLEHVRTFSVSLFSLSQDLTETTNNLLFQGD